MFEHACIQYCISSQYCTIQSSLPRCTNKIVYQGRDGAFHNVMWRVCKHSRAEYDPHPLEQPVLRANDPSPVLPDHSNVLLEMTVPLNSCRRRSHYVIEHTHPVHHDRNATSRQCVNAFVVTLICSRRCAPTLTRSSTGYHDLAHVDHSKPQQSRTFIY
jgi:hypothetical protein